MMDNGHLTTTTNPSYSGCMCLMTLGGKQEKDKSTPGIVPWTIFGSFLQIYNLNISNKRNKMEQEVEGRT